MSEGNEIAGTITILVGVLIFWKARPLGEFIGNFRNDRTNEIAGRVVGALWVAGGLYFIFG